MNTAWPVQPMFVDPSRTVVETAKPSAAPPKRKQLFRDEAVQAYLSSLRESEVLRVAPPWTRVVFFVVASLVAVALVASFHRIEETSRARGILRVTGGSQLLATQAAGVVLEVRAHSGDAVQPGDVIATIDSAATQKQLFEAKRDIQRANEQLAAFGERRVSLYAERSALLKQRIGISAQRERSQGESIDRLSQQRGIVKRLGNEGLATRVDESRAEDEVGAAVREQMRLRDDVMQTKLQLANLAQEMEAERVRLEEARKAAEDRAEALSIALQQTTIRAARAGRLEAVLVKPGDVLTSGATIGRLVPSGTPLQIVTFVPEQDRAFLKPGSVARVELDQLPASEFGMVHAKVVRVSQELASPPEVKEALGEGVENPGTVFRAELELVQDDGAKRLEPYLRSGSLLTARTALRERRIITVLFEPLRKWL